MSTLLFNDAETGSICILFEPMKLKLFSVQPQEVLSNISLTRTIELEECASVSKIPLVFLKKNRKFCTQYMTIDSRDRLGKNNGFLSPVYIFPLI